MAALLNDDPLRRRLRALLHATYHRSKIHGHSGSGRFDLFIHGERDSMNKAVDRLCVMLAESRFVCPHMATSFCEPSGRLHHGRHPDALTLDRVVNSRGYVWDNIQFVSWTFNRVKSDLSPAAMVALGNALAAAGAATQG